ncbi:MAG TPA: hypothetical protein VM140_09950 [Burkholderiales bacterium]|nr:hypothetical protein [Burkholderiales bacterium]
MKRLLLCTLLIPTWAAASCGSAFCTVNTSWEAQGAWTEPGTRLDFRYEYINQDQPMSGSRKVGVGEIRKHHDEVYTRNRNYLTAIDHTLDADWGVNVLVPVVSREHLHIHNHMGAQLEERWDFTALGDVRVLARRRLASFEDQEPSHGVAAANFGLKLPTGKTDVKNGDGDPAERSLQPGSGTTDLLIGASYSRLRPTKNLSTFVQGLVQLPLYEHDDYKPGNRVSLDAGMRYGVGEQVGLLLQANALWRGRDRGAEAEPDDSGGTGVFLSPGLSYSPTKAFNLYGFFQVPLYQYVNGVQLTARRAFTIGANLRF